MVGPALPERCTSKHLPKGVKRKKINVLLFNLALEWKMRQTPPPPPAIKIGEARCDRLAYADDVDLCGEDLEELEHTLRTFKETSSKIGLAINEDKTKILKASREGGELGNTVCAEMNLEVVDKFKYLGSTVTASNRVEEEIRIRIEAVLYR